MSYSKSCFARGYLVTDNTDITVQYAGWSKTSCGKYQIYCHPDTHIHISRSRDHYFVLIGHAYNPFTGEYNEDDLLKSLSSIDEFTAIIDKINEWTGLFTFLVIDPDQVRFLGDCACMQSAYYGQINGYLFISTHAQLIGDICNLQKSEYVCKMQKYRFWEKYGLFLPGDHSQFDDVKRLVPNTYITYSDNGFSVERFFPTRDIQMVSSKEEYNLTIEKIADILYENMRLISLKWDHPAISMTGGMDSKTTVACANGLYDKYKFYSYVSMDGDKPDAVAAKQIADAIGVKHTIYQIPLNDKEVSDAQTMRNIIQHNIGDIGKVNANDVRKRAYFYDTPEFDVEVKSWVSEIGRANYYKKFGKSKMPYRLSPRDMTTMYKFFSYNRIMAHKTDKIFKEYIEKTHFNDIFNYDASDMYLWEFRYGSWGGLVITGEHRVSYDITIPFNNRLLINEFLRLPLKKRIKDIPHYDVIKKANPVIDRLGITITNWNETTKRMYMEKLYWYLNHIF